MSEIIIVGHKNPDLDTVASSIAYAEFKKKLGINAIAMVPGKIDDETKFILEKFEIDIPEIIDSIKDKQLILVDHCANCQMVNDYDNAQITEVIDHHNISGDIKTAKPIKYHCEPVGSTSTIIAEYYLNYNVEMSNKIAKLLLAGMISDTDLFKSPTTTSIDLKIKKILEEKTGIDSNKLGIEMFKVKSNIDSKTMSEIINEDSKNYELNNNIKANIAQTKLMDLDSFLNSRKDELVNEMKTKLNDYDLVIVIVTDLIKEGSEVFVMGKTELFEKAMNVKLENNSVFISGLLSRKKQVVPPLMDLK